MDGLIEFEAAIASFAARYIRQEFRTRFIHEAGKKPGKLHWRVCHAIEQLFEDRWRATPERLPGSGCCLYLGNSGFEVIPWAAFTADMMGDGGLIMSHDGQWFWARSEAGKQLPAVDYHSAEKKRPAIP